MLKFRTYLFQIWFRLSRPLTLGVRAIVEDEKGQVLLVRHTYTPGLYLPGGGVEKGEPAHSALQRELSEEAGIILIGPAELIGIYSNHRIFRNDHVLLYKVKANQWKMGIATNRGEISESLWIDPKTPPADTTPGNTRRLQEIYNNTEPCYYW